MLYLLGVCIALTGCQVQTAAEPEKEPVGLTEPQTQEQQDWTVDVSCLIQKELTGRIPMQVLSEEERALLSELPVEELPREAVSLDWETLTCDTLWRNLLLPMAFDAEEDVTLYGVISLKYYNSRTPDRLIRECGMQGDGVVLRYGEQTAYFPLEWWGSFWMKSNPTMEIADFDGDGLKEAVVCMNAAVGQGTSQSYLYCFDLDTMTGSVPDVSDINIQVIYGEEECKATVSSGGQSMAVDWNEAFGAMSGVQCGSYLDVYKQNGQYYIRSSLEFCFEQEDYREVSYTLGWFCAPVVWEDGICRLGNDIVLTQEQEAYFD